MKSHPAALSICKEPINQPRGVLPRDISMPHYGSYSEYIWHLVNHKVLRLEKCWHSVMETTQDLLCFSGPYMLGHRALVNFHCCTISIPLCECTIIVYPFYCRYTFPVLSIINNSAMNILIYFLVSRYSSCLEYRTRVEFLDHQEWSSSIPLDITQRLSKIVPIYIPILLYVRIQCTLNNNPQIEGVVTFGKGLGTLTF